MSALWTGCGQNLLFLAGRNRISSSQVYAEECRVIEKIGDRITGGRDSTGFAESGRFIFSGHFYVAMIWKVPLTFAVPFVVATWGAVMNCRRVEKP